ncbi:trypsin-4-like [Malaya genurostris]|uniref:trypsin-4-like n=1 Tax=Malaya genurostris TaxID=325434 RepID=UPI0026F39693|nr:trypsin-4-like [Malaya genurostris]
MAGYSNFLLLFSYCIISLSSLNHAHRSGRHASSTGRVVGGSETDISKIPFQISFLSREKPCGGSLIGDRWVLTAAHCTHTIDVKSLQIRVGSSHFASGGQLIQVKRVLQHPQYNNDIIDYDFSLLELTEAVVLNKTFFAVDLPKQDEPIIDGTLLQISGWGQTRNPLECNDVLRVAQVPVVNQEQCKMAYSPNPFDVVTERMLCAGYLIDGGTDTCQGDSGGPLVAGRKLIGVTSWGGECAQPGFPGVYSRVAAVRNWIHKSCGI